MEEKDMSVDFPLLPHQIQTVEGVDPIYSEDGLNRRFAGAKLPTGGGKSFVAMNEILKAAGNDYLSKTNDGVVNNASIMYVAPTNEILFQIQSNIVEFILKKDIDKLTIDECEVAIRSAFSKREADSILKKSDDNIRKNGIIALVRNAFPNLSLKCYATLVSEMEAGTLKEQDPDFVILDEAHRSGATKSQLAVAELLGCEIKNGEPVFDPNSKKKSKVLAISATPERDVDGKNMMDLWAKALDNLTQEQIDNKEHLGMDLDLDTAVREGIVVQPEVIHFDANLVNTPDYKRLVRLHDEATGKTKEVLRQRLDEINRDVIGIPGYDTMSVEEQNEAREKKNIEVMIQAIKDGKVNAGGKMIMFIPHNVEKNGIKPEMPDYLQQKEDFIRKLLADSGLNIEVTKLSSYYDKIDSDMNTTILNNFNRPVGEQNEEDKSAGIKPYDFKIIIASDKLNEGIHAKGITNSFMERNIQEGENTNQRAQTILFLQQIGRTVFSIVPGKEPKARPVIFDYSNNFYTQNRDNPRKDKIEIFQLTETQEKLLKAVRMATLDVYKATAPISSRLPRLIDTLQILREYKFGPNNDIDFIPNVEMFDKNTTLEKLLDMSPLVEKKAEILERLENEDLYNPKKPYKIGKDFCDAKESFWKGTKCFENYDLEVLNACGIIDTKSRTGMKELQAYAAKGFVDLQTGFIKMGVAESFRSLNIYTSTEFDPYGKDIQGFFPGQFDELGYDSDGYDRNGFNDQGIHKETKTIHNSRGFMANGINILTGTEFDLLGYNSQGIKPVIGIEERTDSENPDRIIEVEVVAGGWDKDGYWHLPNSDGEFGGTVSKWSEGYEPKQDVHGFKTDKTHVDTGSKLNLQHFYALGDCYNPDYDDKYRDREGYDIDGFDRDGFNCQGIHKVTGTRWDLNQKTVEVYNEASKAIKAGIDKFTVEQKAKFFSIYPDGKFHYKRNDGSEYTRTYNQNNFDTEGINRITGEYKDIFGFTMIDHATKAEKQRVNEFGFKPSEVPKIVAGKNLRDCYKATYIKGKYFKCNILGTNEKGEMVNNEKHPSLILTENYIRKCMKSGTSIEEFAREYAIQNKMLVPEAEREIRKAFVQATTLYRICPELQKTSELSKVFYTIEPEKVQEFISMCPNLEAYIRKDAKGYTQELERIEKEQDEVDRSPIRNQQDMEEARKKADRLKKQNFAVKKRLEAIKNIPGMEFNE